MKLGGGRILIQFYGFLFYANNFATIVHLIFQYSEYPYVLINHIKRSVFSQMSEIGCFFSFRSTCAFFAYIYPLENVYSGDFVLKKFVTWNIQNIQQNILQNANIQKKTTSQPVYRVRLYPTIYLFLTFSPSKDKYSHGFS